MPVCAPVLKGLYGKPTLLSFPLCSLCCSLGMTSTNENTPSMVMLRSPLVLWCYSLLNSTREKGVGAITYWVVGFCDLCSDAQAVLQSPQWKWKPQAQTNGTACSASIDTNNRAQAPPLCNRTLLLFRKTILQNREKRGPVAKLGEPAPCHWSVMSNANLGFFSCPQWDLARLFRKRNVDLWLGLSLETNACDSVDTPGLGLLSF